MRFTVAAAFTLFLSFSFPVPTPGFSFAAEQKKATPAPKPTLTEENTDVEVDSEPEDDVEEETLPEEEEAAPEPKTETKESEPEPETPAGAAGADGAAAATESATPPIEGPPEKKLRPEQEGPKMLSERGRWYSEFKEVSLAVRPGYADVTDRPAGFDSSAFAIGAHVSYFILKEVGLHVPYTFIRLNDEDVHSVGGGPVVRYLNWKMLRGQIDANALYIRALGGNHFGWSTGIDFTVGFPNALFKPYLGPFFRVESAYLPGPNLRTLIIGLTITLTGYSDID